MIDMDDKRESSFLKAVSALVKLIEAADRESQIETGPQAREEKEK
jgi:hypothetical protein